jgi:hypothetical protein
MERLDFFMGENFHAAAKEMPFSTDTATQWYCMELSVWNE